MNHVYHDDLPMLSTLWPLLKEDLLHSDWKFREAAIFALGSMADDCDIGIKFHLAKFIPDLIECSSENKEAVVRATSYSTLDSYVESNVVEPRNEKHYFKPLLDAILKGVLDDEKMVQSPACYALSTVLVRC